MSTLYRIAVRADMKSYPVLYERKRYKTGIVFTRIEHHTGTVGREDLVHEIPIITCEYRAFSLTWPASTLIYWNKRKHLHEKRVQLPEDFLGTPTWPPFHCFWYINMAAVTSCENAPFTSVSVGPSPRSYSFTPAMVLALGCTVPKCGTEPIQYVKIQNSRSARRSFVPQQKSRRDLRYYVWSSIWFAFRVGVIAVRYSEHS